jgi:hypothetical protein
MLVTLIVIPVLPALASLVLLGHWRTDSVTLHERAVIAVRDWLVASIVALLSLNALLEWGWPALVRAGGLYVALLAVSLPSAYWLWLYLWGRFR